MAQSHFSLKWESYKTDICTGFSSLQHNGEFVDMSLAADGHIVKVHQVVMALSSPYLKELISSVPCQHPVIFLNKISHATLCLILEYIYTGQVLVPSSSLTAFIQAAKALYIKGLQNVVPDTLEDNIPSDLSNINTTAIEKKSSTTEKIFVPSDAKRIALKQEPDPLSSQVRASIPIGIDDDNLGSPDADMLDNDNHTLDQCDKNSSLKNNSIQFTLSIRGSLQVILNRYMYNLHCSKASGERRWRCLDYRKANNKKCLAFVITHDNVVKKRANLHNHPFHDDKILTKIKKKSVFSAIDDIKNYHQSNKLETDRRVDKDFEEGNGEQ